VAAESRTQGAPLADDTALLVALSEEATSFGFFQTVRLLERLFPERQPVGGFGDPGEEAARFVVTPAIAFPPSEIRHIELHTEPAEMSVNFLGLIGPQGVLPYHYSLLVADRLRAGDRAPKAFLDLFHHRLISLFYLAWLKHRFAVGYERDQRDPVTEHLLDLVGVGLDGFRGRLPVSDQVLVFYAGLLGAQQRSAAALEGVLADYFGVPVTVEQFVGGWYPLASDTRCLLGEERDESSQVGLGAVVGDEVWDQQARVRIRIGPLSRERHAEFLPGGAAHGTLQALTAFFSDDRFDFEVQLVLARADVPACVLDDGPDAGLPLGWSTWISTRPLGRDADETILTFGHGRTT
jgi:type VI secretion system protein ImpH